MECCPLAALVRAAAVRIIAVRRETKLFLVEVPGEQICRQPRSSSQWCCSDAICLVVHRAPDGLVRGGIARLHGADRHVSDLVATRTTRRSPLPAETHPPLHIYRTPPGLVAVFDCRTAVLPSRHDRPQEALHLNPARARCRDRRCRPGRRDELQRQPGRRSGVYTHASVRRCIYDASTVPTLETRRGQPQTRDCPLQRGLRVRR